MRWIVLVMCLVMVACGGEPTPAADAAVDQLEAAIADAPPADAGPGPTPQEWARCPENIADLGYTVTSCSNISGARGLTHPRRMMSAEPTWVCDSVDDANRGMTMEECIAAMVRADPRISQMARCDLAAFPPPCRCDTCGSQAFRVRECSGYETTGRLYMVEQLNIIAQMIATSGHCPRL